MYLFNNNNNTVQVRKGKKQANLVNLDIQGGDKAEDREGGQAKEQKPKLPLMFLGLVAAMAVPTKGENNFVAVGYDCSNPTNIKVYNAGACCQHESYHP